MASTFGTVTDYFGLASATLVAESSDGGENRQHVVAYNATGDTPATETSATWMNPRVTYRVVGDMTLSVTLGKGFAAEVELVKNVVKTGYMITSVEVRTAIGEPPTVTVSAVANEGFRASGQYKYAEYRDAVKTYQVGVRITGRHRPQNLQLVGWTVSPVSGGGELQSLTMTATCDPVVVAEGGIPVASDVVHGRVEVTAVTAAYDGESAPSAGNGFTMTGCVTTGSGTGYKNYHASVRREL